MQTDYNRILALLFSFIAYVGTAQSIPSITNHDFSNDHSGIMATGFSENAFPNVFGLTGLETIEGYRFSGFTLAQQALLPQWQTSDSNVGSGPLIYSNQYLTKSIMKTSFLNSEWHANNRRNIYSGLWAFASLNYLYADLVQFMDKEEHLQYHTGVVNGFEMTPGFIAGSAVFMQVALANVFLPQIIKNEKTLRWVQILSGTIMTLVQTATLFVTQPTPYYATFSAFEIAATAFITIDAVRWKVK